MLDEPTIGLHPRDNQILLDALHKLGDKGNTLVVVEHDEDTIRRADHIIDIGPGAGKRGGRLVAQGTAADLAAQPDSRDRPLSARIRDRIRCRRVARCARGRRARERRHWLTVRGAKLHNLRDVDGRCRCSGWSRSRASAVPASRRSRATCCWPTLCAVVVQRVHARPRRDAGAAGKLRRTGWLQLQVDGLANRSTACSKSTRRRSARRRARARPPTSASGTRSASCSPTRSEAQGARLRAGALLLQHRRRPLPRLRRPGRAHHRDELPARREGAVRRLPRRALQSGDAGGDVARQEHRRRAADGGRRGGRVLRRRCPTSRIRCSC